MLSDALEILVRGGPVMVPIIAVSLAAWVIVFARMFAIKRESLELGEFLWRLESRLRTGGRESALELCWESELSMASMLGALFTSGKKRAISRKARRRMVSKAVQVVHGRTARQLPLLVTLAAAATLLGLLGTVAGMVSSFGVVTLHGTGEPALLAKGISQALITTEAGLVVALPLLLMHSYLQSRADAASVVAHRKLLEISAMLGSGGTR